MPYSKVKVYSDGGHYIGIPYKPNPSAGKRRVQEEETVTVFPKTADKDKSIIEKQPSEHKTNDTSGEAVLPSPKQMTRKELFDDLYDNSRDMKRNDFVEQNFERKHRNLVCRKIRMWRKINQQTFNFFVTLTFDDKLHTEESFQKALKHCLQHFSSRKGWRYIGVWERSPEKQRLHFHGIFYIPEDTMPGKFESITDFDTRAKKMRVTMQNDFFGKKFGRNDFKEIRHDSEVPQAIKYLTKYLEKTGEKLVYSRGLYQYFVTDVMDEDILCPYGQEDRKFILSDNFSCWDEGEYIGPVSPETIAKLPKSN